MIVEHLEEELASSRFAGDKTGPGARNRRGASNPKWTSTFSWNKRTAVCTKQHHPSSPSRPLPLRALSSSSLFCPVCRVAILITLSVHSHSRPFCTNLWCSHSLSLRITRLLTTHHTPTHPLLSRLLRLQAFHTPSDARDPSGDRSLHSSAPRLSQRGTHIIALAQPSPSLPSQAPTASSLVTDSLAASTFAALSLIRKLRTLPFWLCIAPHCLIETPIQPHPQH